MIIFWAALAVVLLFGIPMAVWIGFISGRRGHPANVGLPQTQIVTATSYRTMRPWILKSILVITIIIIAGWIIQLPTVVGWIRGTDLSVLDAVTILLLLIGTTTLVYKGFIPYFLSGGNRFPKMIAGFISGIACLYLIAWIGYVSALGWTEGRARMTNHVINASSWAYETIGIAWTVSQALPTQNITEPTAMIQARNSGQIIAPVNTYSVWLEIPADKCIHWWTNEPETKDVKTKYVNASGEEWRGDRQEEPAKAQAWKSNIPRRVHVFYETVGQRSDGSCPTF